MAGTAVALLCAMPMPLSITSSSSSAAGRRHQLQAQLDAADVGELHCVASRLSMIWRSRIGIDGDNGAGLGRQSKQAPARAAEPGAGLHPAPGGRVVQCRKVLRAA
jgi:hypothetical protein